MSGKAHAEKPEGKHPELLRLAEREAVNISQSCLEPNTVEREKAITLFSSLEN